MWEAILSHYNYWVVIFLMMVGLYIVFETGNLIKRLVGLSIFQTSLFLLYVSLGKVSGGTAPILLGKKGDKDAHGGEEYGAEGAADAAADYAAEPVAEILYSNPLPHVLILTAIVVGVSTLSVGLGIAVRIREAYGTVESGELRAADISVGEAEEARS